MKRIVHSIFLAAIFMATACTIQDIESAFSATGEKEIRAWFGDPSTKVNIDGDFHLHWDGDERIGVVSYDGGGGKAIFKYAGSNEQYASFKPEKVREDFEIVDGCVYNAVLPASLMADEFWHARFTVEIPQFQHYVENSYDPNNCPKVASAKPSDGKIDFFFKNVCSFFVFQLYGDEEIRSIKVQKGIVIGDPLCGELAFSDDENEACFANDTFVYYGPPGKTENSFVVLDCGDGVKLGRDKNDATSFYLSVIPSDVGTVFVTFTNKYGREFQKSFYFDEPLKRNTIYRFSPIEPAFPHDPAIVIPEKDILVDPQGGTISVDILSEESIELTVPEDCNWLQFKSFDQSTGKAVFDVTSNTTDDTRSVVVKAENKELGLTSEFKIYQGTADAIVLIDSEYIFDYPYDFYFDNFSDKPIEVSVDSPWLEVTCNTPFKGKTHMVMASGDENPDGQETKVTFTSGENKQVIIVKQPPFRDEMAEERDALCKIYSALNGDLWYVNTNWCTDTPVEYWFGISTAFSRVTEISLQDNNLSGHLTDDFARIKHLKTIFFNYGNITGTIPESLAELEDLELLGLCFNAIEGSIPPSFTPDGPWLWLENNQMSGSVPESYLNSPDWNTSLWSILLHNNYSLSDIPIYIQPYNLYDIDGGIIDLGAEYSKNEYTAFLFWASWCAFSRDYFPTIQAIYDRFRNRGFALFGVNDESDDITRETVTKYGLTFRQTHSAPGIPFSGTPTITVMDKNGRVVFCDAISDSRYLLEEWLAERLPEDSDGESDENYVSTDFSRDGEVSCLQTSAISTSKPLNVILMGDGFTDRDIESGKYDRLMKLAMDDFFSTEPVKTFDYAFNVWSVKAVSTTTLVAKNPDTAFSTSFGEGAQITGNNQKALEYARLATSNLDEAVIIVLLNSQRANAGTTYMYFSMEGKYGNGYSIAYTPTIDEGEAFRDLVVHEAVGHGFAKLGDEYTYSGPSYDTVSSEIKSEIQNFAQYGIYGNLSVDKDNVPWNHFIDPSEVETLVSYGLLDDTSIFERYNNEGIGVYEGGYGYRHGVFRPSANSIMASDASFFNAPSREMIYRKIITSIYSEMIDSPYLFLNFLNVDSYFFETFNSSRQKYSVKNWHIPELTQNGNNLKSDCVIILPSSPNYIKLR